MLGDGEATPAQFSATLRIYAALAARPRKAVSEAGLRFGFGCRYERCSRTVHHFKKKDTYGRVLFCTSQARGGQPFIAENQYTERVMKNYCDYDAIVHYQPGAFNQQYKTILAGKTAEIDRIQYVSQVVESFQNGEYRSFRTLQPLILYRVFGQYSGSDHADAKGAKLFGGFASTEFAESVIDAKLRLALDPSWMNTKMYEAKLLIPTNTTISVGIVAPVRLKSGTILPGGADQVLLPLGWPEEWITGYRRVTGRQLQAQPYFLRSKPGEYDTKNSLFTKICPACGCEQTRVLLEHERFTIIGKKGNRYEMSNVCLNPQCQYYW